MQILIDIFFNSATDEAVAAVDCRAIVVQGGAKDEEVQVEAAEDKDKA